MKTDWHRYNLKRRIANLPSISSSLYAEKVLSGHLKTDEYNENEDENGFYVTKRKQKQNTRAFQVNGSKSRQVLSLRVEEAGRGRQKTLVSPGQREVQVRSTSPAASVASELSEFSLGSTDQGHELSEWDSRNSAISELSHPALSYSRAFDSDDADLVVCSDDITFAEETSLKVEASNISLTTCFYCGVSNGEIESNIKHMFKKHGLYIPERSYLIDIEGLLSYLRDFLVQNKCIVCGYSGRSIQGLRQHMNSKGHCRIPYETKQERQLLARFYDFSFSDPTSDGQDTAKSNKTVVFADENNTTVSEGDEMGSENHYYHQQGEEEEEEEDNLEDINSNYALVQIDSSGVELTTPAGSRIGHRSMVRYYRQNLPLPLATEPDGRKTNALVDRRFAPGLTYHQITKQEREVQRLEQNARNDYVRKLKPKKINYQKHFRDEILGT